MRTAELHAFLLTSHHFDLASDVATGASGLGRRVKKKRKWGTEKHSENIAALPGKHSLAQVISNADAADRKRE